MADHPVPAAATELSPEEHEKLVADVYRYDREVKDGIMSMQAAGWTIAAALHAFNEARGWTVLGYEHLTDWLAEPEIGMPRTTYHRLVRLWGEFVVGRGIEAKRLEHIDPSKVDLVLPALKRGEVTTDEALSDVEALGWRDVREKYAPKKPEAESTVPDVEVPVAVNSGTSEPAWADSVVESVEDAQNDDGDLSGQDLPVINGSAVDVDSEESTDIRRIAVLMAQLLDRIGVEVAPKEKKKMSGELREDLYELLELARDAGLLDHVGAGA